jgi:hypothetical protein
MLIKRSVLAVYYKRLRYIFSSGESTGRIGDTRRGLRAYILEEG